MITFSTKVSNLLSQPTVEAFYLVEIELPTVLRTTSFYTDLTFDNGVTYTNDGRLLTVDPPKLSATVDREQYKITLADPDMYFAQYMNSGLVGTKVSVRVGFVDQNTKVPLPQIANTILVYKGRVDNGAYGVTTDEAGNSVFVLTCSSPMGDLDLVKTMMTSKDALRNIDPTDNSFEQIYEGVGQIELKWGKG